MISILLSISFTFDTLGVYPSSLPIVIELIPPPNLEENEVTSVGGKAVLYNIKTAGFIYFDPCLWNLDSSDPRIEGVTTMSLTRDKLSIESRYSYVAGKGSGWFKDFIGYHRVGYGNHPWESKPYVRPAAYLPLPMKVKDLPNIYIEVNYSIIEKDVGWMDIAFDIWLKRSPPPYRGMARGDLEIMVWLYWEPPLPGGALPLGSANITLIVNKTIVNTEWLVLIVPEVVEPPPGGWTWIIFVSANPLPKGHVVLNLNTFLDKAKHILTNFYWPTKPVWNEDIFHNMYLWDIEFGSEIARKSSGDLYLKWEIYRYSLLLFDKKVDTTVGYHILINNLEPLTKGLIITRTATNIEVLTQTVYKTVTKSNVEIKQTTIVVEVLTIEYTTVVNTKYSLFVELDRVSSIEILAGIAIGALLAIAFNRVRK